MIQVTPELLAALNATANQPVDLYELYLDSGTLYYSDQTITWGGQNYVNKVNSRSAIRRFEGGEFDRVSITFTNVDTALAQVLAANEIEGRRLIIRKVDRTVTNDSIVLFNGEMQRPSRIDEQACVIEGRQLVGSVEHEVPARLFSAACPWEFKGFACGYAGGATDCNKSWARCNELANTAKFGGFRFTPHSGTFQFEEVERKQFLLFFSRKKKKSVTATFDAVDDTPYDVPVPLCYGRVQIAGIPIQHEDTGSETKLLVAFCAGKIKDYFYLRADQVGITEYTLHYGALGGSAGQGVDTRFPDSYPYNLLAYVGLTVPSDVRAVDSAPSITAVLQGREVALFDGAGSFTGSDWTDNPVWCVRDFMTLPLEQGGMGIPDAWFDDVTNAATAAFCDASIANTTNDQKIYSPPDVPAGFDYKRYQSTSIVGGDPTVDGPYSDYDPGVDDDTDTTPASVNVKRFTLNVAIAKQEKAVDVLFKKLLPAFRGYLTFSKEGKIQIRSERAANHTTVTVDSGIGASQVFCAAPSQFAVGDLALLSPFTANAEVLTVSTVLGDRLVFSTNATKAHTTGDEILRVDMTFTDSNIVGGFTYPMSDRQPSTNRVTIKYVDAPAGFEARELRVNDYTHQGKVHKVNNEDLDGSGIDSYFQAWRIGQWRRAKLRDLGKFCEFRADIKATRLEIGDVFAISAVEAGLQAVPFRVIEIGYAENDEVDVLGQLYSTGVYDDTAPQTTVTVPAVFTQSAAEAGQLPPGDVTLGTPQFRYTQPDAQGNVRAEVTVPFSPPDPIGSFDRIHVYLQAPDEAAPNATIGAVGGFTVSPTIVFTANPSTDVLSATAHGLPDGAVMNAASDGTLPGGLSGGVRYYVVSATTDTLKLSLTVGGSPVDITSAGAGFHRLFWADTSRVLTTSQPVSKGVFAYVPTRQILTVEVPVPAQGQDDRIYAVSGSPWVENPLVRADEANPSPSVVIRVAPPPPFVSGEEFAPNATAGAGSVEYRTIDGGDQEWRYAIAWTVDAADPRYASLGGYDVVFESPAGSREIVSSPSRSDSTFTSDWRAVPPAAEGYKIWLDSWANGGRDKNTIVAGVTPSWQFTVARQTGGTGVERTALVTGFAATFDYRTDGSGQLAPYVDFAWTEPGVPTFGGAVMHMIRGGIDYTLTGVERGGSFRYDLPDFPASNDATTVYALSSDTNNFLNSYVPGVTPSQGLTLTPPPVGGGGAEYCDQVTPATTFVEVGAAIPAPDGTYRQPVTVDATAPPDPKWGSIDVVVKYGDGSYLTWATNITRFPARFMFRPPSPAADVTFYGVSRDVNNRRNSIVDGVTPSQVVNVGATAQLNLGAVLAASIDASLAVVSAVLGVKSKGITQALIADFAVAQGQLANAQIIDAGRIVDGAVDTVKLVNLAVTNAKIANLAVDGAKIANAAIGTAHIQAAAITTALIQNAAITNALIGAAAIQTANIGDAQVTSAKILSLVADKITGGVISATVTMSSPVLVVTAGTTVVNIDATNKVKVSDSTLDRYVSLDAAFVSVVKTSDANRNGFLTYDTVKVQYALGKTARLDADADGGHAGFTNAAGTTTVGIHGDIGIILSGVGIRIVPAALPGSPSSGYLTIDSGDGNKLKWHNGSSWQSAGGSGTVTSVGLTAPAEITVTGQPVTGSGTIQLAWLSQFQNKIFASPNGSNGVPSFRAMAHADLPTTVQRYFGYSTSDPAGSMIDNEYAFWWDGSTMWMVFKQSGNKFRVGLAGY